MKQATENCEERPADRNEYKRPKLIDFGPIGALTQAGTHPGTLVYMAPEQIDGAEVDGRSDVYSMASVLYECLAGTRYFERPGVRKSERALMDAICELPPVRRDTVVSMSERLF